MAKAAAKTQPRRPIVCYLCGHESEVSAKTLSTNCPGCHRAIKVEDIVVKSYVPVIDLATCGSIRIQPKGRVAAKRIHAGGELINNGALEGVVEAAGPASLGAKSSWKGERMTCPTLSIKAGAELQGHVTVQPDT